MAKAVFETNYMENTFFETNEKYEIWFSHILEYAHIFSLPCLCKQICIKN